VAQLLVRHAKAGKRTDWEGDDRHRPLDEKGWRQAEGLVEALAPYRVTRLASSGATRCTQTLEPLAEALGLEIEPRWDLEEGATREQTLALMAELGDGAVLCTHGEILETLFGEEGQKGSTRIVDLENGVPVVREYLSPPG
jgi:phosphohistidine phosphatase SixA